MKDQNLPQANDDAGHFKVPTLKECQQINEACDRFWRKRGMASPSDFRYIDFRTKKIYSSEADSSHPDEGQADTD